MYICCIIGAVLFFFKDNAALKTNIHAGGSLKILMYMSTDGHNTYRRVYTCIYIYTW